MSYSPIAKPTRDWTVAPNLLDYERERRPDFWERARGELTGRLGSLDAFVGYLGERLGVPASEAR